MSILYPEFTANLSPARRIYISGMEKKGAGGDRAHFIGIGGVSMSALAMFYKAAGFEVSGSDISEGAFTEALRENGVEVAIGHSAENVRDCGVVIKNAAISGENPELAAAVERGIPVKDRSEVLGEIAAAHKYCIAVAGSHGKTTCGGMLANIFMTAGMDPSAHIGGVMLNTGSQYVIGGGEYFITEACEYKRGFLHIKPDVAVVLNVAMDHPDCYKDIGDISCAFFEFISGVKEGGAAVLNGDDETLRLSAQMPLPVRQHFFGLEGHNEYRAANIAQAGGRYSFGIVERGESLCRVSLKILGKHNIYNALAACAAARQYGISPGDIKAGLEGFAGMRRRFEYWGRVNGAEVYHDYAHHPQEIAATVLAARQALPHGRMICVFQPHTYTRTQKLFDKFVDALQGADVNILAEIYPAREKPIDGVTGGALKDALLLKGNKAYACADFPAVCGKIKELAREGDVALILGAGDIDKLKELLF